MKAYFVHNDQELLEIELPSFPQNGDIVYIERWGESVRYIVLGRTWALDKDEQYVKIEVAQR